MLFLDEIVTIFWCIDWYRLVNVDEREFCRKVLPGHILSDTLLQQLLNKT